MKLTGSKKKRANMELANIGSFFHRKRLEAGLSEEMVLAYLGDISLQTLKQYESGKRLIPLSHIYALTNCLNLSPELVMSMVSSEYRQREIEP